MKKSFVKYSLIVVFIVTLLFSLSGCTACAREQWQQVYDSYTNEKYKDRFVYQDVDATIENVDKLINSKQEIFNVIIEEKDYPEVYGGYIKQGYYFVPESIEILANTDFFNDINETTIITFTINSYIGWDGWCYPVFAVSIGEKTYLDFETGKENVLNYVQQRIEDPLGN